MSGLAALNAGPDGAPRYVPSVVVDKLTGQTLASMIGMALFHRERMGQGQEVHVPMLETMLSFLLVEHLWGAVLNQPELGLGYPRMLTPHRRPYATLDGYISVIAVSDAHWRRLFEAMDRSALIEDPRFATIAARSDNVDALYAVLADGMRERTTAAWLHVLSALDIPCGPVNSLTDLLQDNYLHETDFFQQMQHPLDGDVTLTAIPARFSASPPSVRTLWPALGQHTTEVLREIGCDASEIDAIAGSR
jgi:crotonobetainyl-CoA:carnitine CoA-transferase CaiB-like acyl-CoA transferase